MNYTKLTKNVKKTPQNPWLGFFSTLPENAILVTAKVVDLYPSISHQAGLGALKEGLENKHN